MNASEQISIVCTEPNIVAVKVSPPLYEKGLMFCFLFLTLLGSLVVHVFEIVYGLKYLSLDKSTYDAKCQKKSLLRIEEWLITSGSMNLFFCIGTFSYIILCNLKQNKIVHFVLYTSLFCCRVILLISGCIILFRDNYLCDVLDIKNITSISIAYHIVVCCSQLVGYSYMIAAYIK